MDVDNFLKTLMNLAIALCVVTPMASCGDADEDPSDSAQDTESSGDFEVHESHRLSVGSGFGCVIESDGQVVCWGNNSYGELGRGERTIEPLPAGPAISPDGRPFVGISSRHWHTCGVTDDGRAWCWGENTSGSLGNGEVRGSASPSEVLPPITGERVVWSTVEAVTETVCGLTVDGRVYCWGSNLSGALGIGYEDADTNSAPQRVVFDPTVSISQIAPSGGEFCALSTEGQVLCWGSRSPIPVLVLDRPEDVVVRLVRQGNWGLCGETTSGQRWCWRQRDPPLLDGSSPAWDEYGAGVLCDLPGSSESLRCTRGERLSWTVTPDVEISEWTHFATNDGQTDLSCAMGRDEAGGSHVVCWDSPFDDVSEVQGVRTHTLSGIESNR